MTATDLGRISSPAGGAMSIGTLTPAIRPASGEAGGVIKVGGHKGKPPEQGQFRVSDRSDFEPHEAAAYNREAGVPQQASSVFSGLSEQQHETACDCSLPVWAQHAETLHVHANPNRIGCAASKADNSMY